MSKSGIQYGNHCVQNTALGDHALGTASLWLLPTKLLRPVDQVRMPFHSDHSLGVISEEAHGFVCGLHLPL